MMFTDYRDRKREMLHACKANEKEWRKFFKELLWAIISFTWNLRGCPSSKVLIYQGLESTWLYHEQAFSYLRAGNVSLKTSSNSFSWDSFCNGSNLRDNWHGKLRRPGHPDYIIIAAHRNSRGESTGLDHDECIVTVTGTHPSTPSPSKRRCSRLIPW